MNKPKLNQPETPYEPQGRDNFQTPNYATDLIARYLRANDFTMIWEPCCGVTRKIERRLHLHHGIPTFGTDLIYGAEYNVLEHVPNQHYDLIVTNPPYSIKKKIVDRFISLDKPFALLIPGDWNQWIVEAMKKYGCRLLVPNRRINFITPSGKQGKESSAMFHSVWLTRYLLPDKIVFANITLEDLENV